MVDLSLHFFISLTIITSIGILVKSDTAGPPHKGHFGDNINSAALSFVERFIVLCPYLGESTFDGSTVQWTHEVLGYPDPA